MDLNPAISARVVFPQSGHIVFPKISTFFQNRTIQKVWTAHRGPIYQIKAISFLWMDSLCTTLNINICSKVNLGKSWGNTAYWIRIPGVYTDPWSNGLTGRWSLSLWDTVLWVRLWDTPLCSWEGECCAGPPRPPAVSAPWPSGVFGSVSPRWLRRLSLPRHWWLSDNGP